jgi:hypothetical protein
MKFIIGGYDLIIGRDNQINGKKDIKRKYRLNIFLDKISHFRK